MGIMLYETFRVVNKYGKCPYVTLEEVVVNNLNEIVRGWVNYFYYGHCSNVDGSLDSDGESLWKKMIGKPYSGKLNVRFDEGELEIGHLPLRQFSTLPWVILFL